MPNYNKIHSKIFQHTMFLVALFLDFEKGLTSPLGGMKGHSLWGLVFIDFCGNFESFGGSSCLT